MTPKPTPNVTMEAMRKTLDRIDAMKSSFNRWIVGAIMDAMDNDSRKER